MAMPSPSHLILIANILSTGSALKHLVRDRDCCKLETRTCWRSPNNVSDKQLIFHIALIFVAVKIPVIVVFTKYDLLVMEHFRASSHIRSLPDRKVEARKRAEKAFKEVTKDLPFIFAPVSSKDYRGPLLGL
jgi:hypothetical protein